MNKIIKSDKEKRDLLGDMVNFQRQLGIPTLDWADYFERMLIKWPTIWSLVTHNEPFKEEYVRLWIENYGEWYHCSGRTKEHNNLGMAYGWWALKERKIFSDFKLSDSPDFRGEIINKNHKVTVIGDIGQCTSSAISTGMQMLFTHDLWISVLDWNTHIVIEFMYNAGLYYAHATSDLDDDPVPVLEQIKDIFFCKHCNEWTITKSNIEKIAKIWGSEKNRKNKSESRKITRPILDKYHQLSLWDKDDCYS